MKNTATPAAETTDTLITGLIPFALANIGHPRLVRKVSLAIAAWQFGKLAVGAWKKLHEKPTPSLIIYSNQPIFGHTLLWLSRLQIISDSEAKSFFVNESSSAQSDPTPVSPTGACAAGAGASNASPLALSPAGNVNYLWRDLTVTCSHERASMESKGDRINFSHDKLTLTVPQATEATLLQLIQEIDHVGRTMSAAPKVPWVHYYKWHWQRIRKLDNRSAVLPDGLLEALVNDIQTFRAARDWYQSVGMPHRRGFLFAGIPGSGKTSTVQALASLLKMDIYWINLSTMSDDDLLSAVNAVGDNDILLIEDADCVSATASRESESSEGTSTGSETKCTLGGLLNAIDGAATPDGRILIMTTNHPERLDPALLRPGRIDRQIDFTYATAGQIEELARRFGFCDKAAILAAAWAAETLSMAEVQERLIQKHAAK